MVCSVHSAKALYSDDIFFNLRNSFQELTTKHLQACLTPLLISHFFIESRLHIAAWLADKSREGLKLPMGEGIIFLSSNADSFRLQRPIVTGDTGC